jgi:dihydroflavonol-4-reductase
MKAFVTGSTGLLGSNLVNTLVAAGHEVRALARSRAKAETLFQHPAVEVVVGDMEDIPAFAPHLAGSDVLFHTAAYVHETFGPGNHWPRLEKINVRGTLDLLAQAERYGIKAAVHTSSTGVLGIGPKGTPADETVPPDDYARSDPYSRSKVLAEAAIADFIKSHRLPVMLVLPAMLLGPQDTGPSAPGKSIIQIMERKFPVIPPGGVSIVDARDVATAMVNMVERGRSGERYIVSGGYRTLEQLAQTVSAVSGVPIPTRHVSYAAVNIAAHASELASRITGAPPMMSVSAIKALNRKHEVSAEKAIRELGVTFRPFEDTVRDTVSWFVANGYVRPQMRLAAT